MIYRRFGSSVSTFFRQDDKKTRLFMFYCLLVNFGGRMMDLLGLVFYSAKVVIFFCLCKWVFCVGELGGLMGLDRVDGRIGSWLLYGI